MNPMFSKIKKLRVEKILYYFYFNQFYNHSICKNLEGLLIIINSIISVFVLVVNFFN
jgi:hypothetical protein